jgi:putative ABC transport system permease protein
VVALSGIAFANVLIFMQLGFRSLFTTGAVLLPESLQGDLFLVDAASKYIGDTGFDRARLYQAAAIAGVKETIPVYIRTGEWAYNKDIVSYGARVIAYDPRKTVLNLPEVTAKRSLLSQPFTVVFDRSSRDSLGPLPQQLAVQPVVPSFLNQRRVAVVGLFTLGSSFFLSEGNILTSDFTYGEIFGGSALNQVAVGVIQVMPGSDRSAIQRGIQQTVQGVKVLTHQQLIERELAFQNSNPASAIFGFGAVMGLIIGIVIVYQVLYADVSDHLAEYATLKAIGYSNRGLLVVIFQQAAMLAVLGFIPGCFAAWGMYELLATLTRLRLILYPELIAAVFLLTLIMCLISAAIASNKLRSADPADIF